MNDSRRAGWLAALLLSLALEGCGTASNERWLLLGCSKESRLLVVAHSEHQDEIRIISARLATRREREAYEEDR